MVASSLFDPADPEAVRDPYPSYAKLHAGGGLAQLTSGAWVVASYELVQQVLRDTRSFRTVGPPPPDVVWPTVLLSVDPPDHTRLRHAVAADFTKRAMVEVAPVVTAIAEPLVDELVAASEAEVISGLCTIVPLRVIAHLLGVPAERTTDLRRWADAIVDLLAISIGGRDAADLPEAEGNYLEFVDWITTQVRGVPTGVPLPGGSILHRLVAQSDDLEVSEHDVVSLGVFLLFAGHETTLNLLGSMLWRVALLKEPRAVLSTDEQRRRFIEEVLRYESPIQRTARIAAGEVTLGATVIPAGSLVLAYMGAANRDPAIFEAPDDFRYDRDPNPHVAFGSGIHLCLGAPLARLEATIVLDLLLERCRTVDLLSDDPPCWRSRPGSRGPERLPLRVRS